MFNQNFNTMKILKKIVCFIALYVLTFSGNIAYSQTEEIDWAFENKDVLFLYSTLVLNNSSMLK